MNLESYLFMHHQGTHLQILRLLIEGNVMVNGTVVTSPRTPVKETDQVLVEGVDVTHRQAVTYLVNKPVGMASSLSRDGSKTVGSVFNEVDLRPDLQLIQPLPREAAGIVLVTSSQAFAHHVTDQEWSTSYELRFVNPLSTQLEQRLRGQLNQLTPEVERIRPAVTYQIKVRNHQESALYQVALELGQPATLARREIGPLKLNSALSTGQYRALNEREIDLLEGNN
ncbi:hypothetical protein [Levilactobacillus bambusae]|uniref:Uncharacterized protein n=1 Tax=Levilactobacillus bambusae TaxID=2024736 RepID=A0A2V1N5Q2_9LACO|nr:hypothetical protein [Levilactobacillus bambusae]PWG01086.1 hypothetical protein DCM90_02620 [Levilactobacillus bambusae]